MQIKKLLKYLPMTVMAAGLAVAATTPSLSLLNNSDHLKNQIFNVDQTVNETEYTDKLQYIRNDVAKQDGVTNSVKSIKLSDSSSISNSSAALVTKTDGSTLLYMWGNNYYGQLGNTTNNRTENPNPTPTLVNALSGKKITQIALGSQHSAAFVTETDGSMLLYMWGDNRYGQLGFTANITPNPTPTLVDATPFSTDKITQIALGSQHSAALATKTDGSTLLYMWGYNGSGQLGFTTNNTPNPAPAPVDSALFGSRKITQIALGGSCSTALVTETDGQTLLYMWGNNGSGQLGFTANNTPNHTPTPVTALDGQKITQIALSGSHSAALTTKTDGSTLLYMWGQNATGQLGNTTNSGTSTPTPTPTLVDATPFGSRKITQISLGFDCSAALLADDSLYMWGRNNYGQLGFPANGDTSNPTPAKVDATPFSTNKITQIALGSQHSAALLKDGSLYMWGSNRYGQLGNEINDGEWIPNPTPTWMSKLGKDSHITANTTITAKEAVDNIWVDNKFNLTGFKNSFNLINIPETTDQEITMDTKPTYDNATGTVTMTVKIKYFYNEDGLLVPDTAAKEMTFTGFVPAAAEDQNPATNNQDPFPWWWIIIGIGGAAIIGVGIWFVIKKRKEAEAKPADGEPNSKDPKDDEKKTSETEAKSEEAAKTDNHPIDKIVEETKTEEASKPKSLKKTKK